MELQVTPFTCQRDGLTIRGTEYRPAGSSLPAVILSHGFGGTVNTPFFCGMVQPGAADVQHYKGSEIIRFCADYVLEGTDYTGEACQIHIVNENLGNGWHPTITTDSEALCFLNEVDLTEPLEERRAGPMVRIFAQLP